MLAVVDPGVGTDRRSIAVEVENGYLVGPDNGLLAPAVAMLGGPQRVVELTSTEYQLPSPGPTFAGRDVMAPAAAHLARGHPDRRRSAPRSTRPRSRPRSSRSRKRTKTAASPARCSGSTASATASSMSLPSSSRPRAPGPATRSRSASASRRRIGERPTRRARWVRTFADAKPSELILLVDSYGMCTTRPRPPLGGDRATAVHAGSPITLATERGAPGIGCRARRPDRAGPQGGPMRRGTSLILVLLLAAIFLAAIIQFTVKV